MNSADIYFSKLPTPQQLVSKAAGLIQRSKVSLTHITLTHKQETITLTKDPATKEWKGTGKIAGTSGSDLVG